MNEIRQAYSELLQSKPWDDFFTVTFRSPRRDALSAQASVWKTLSKEGATRAFMGVEPHKSGDLHIHGLVYGSSGFVPALALPWDLWHTLYERFGRSKVEACDSLEHVSAYCSKYILKSQNSVTDHYGFFGSPYHWKD